MKKYKYFVKSLESILEDTPGNINLIKHAAWGNGYVIVPITHPLAATKHYMKATKGRYDITYSRPVETKIHWGELNDEDRGMWLFGISFGAGFQDGVEIAEEYVEKETIGFRDALMKLNR